MIVPAAAIAGVAYQYYDFTSTSSSNGHAKVEYEKHPTSSSNNAKVENEKLEAPKPVEDRHGDTVAKHAMAAHKNQDKVREGTFKGGEFDNHLQKHSVERVR
jgi:hypothetical protein